MQAIIDFFVALFTGRKRVPVGGDHPRRPQRAPKNAPPKPVEKPRTVDAKPVAPAPQAPPLQPAPEAAPIAPVEPLPPAVDFLDTLVAEDRTLIGPADFDAAAAALGCESAAVEAVAAVESGRFGPFDAATGRPIILFEPHIFSRRTRKAFDLSNPRVSYPTWNPRAYPRTQAERWEQLREAFGLDQDDALMSASYGRFQIMGFNHQLCGFATVFEFVSDIARSDARHLAAFVAFIKSNPKLLSAIRAKNWAEFALNYNGPSALQPGQEYDKKIAAAYEQAKARRAGV